MFSIELNDENIFHWTCFMKNAIAFIDINRCILDQYVLDFFTQDHWNNLNSSWQHLFKEIKPQDLADIIDLEQPPRQKQVWPLSFLAFRKASAVYSLPRKCLKSPDSILSYLEQKSNNPERGKVDNKSLIIAEKCNENSRDSNIQDNFISLSPDLSKLKWEDPCFEFSVESGQHKLLNHVFRRHLKPKKQHEISRLAYVASEVSNKTQTGLTVDVGSGQGHLSRLLSYGFGVNVFCLDAEDQFINGAKKFDLQLEMSMKKMMKKDNLLPKLPSAPKHGVYHLKPDLDVKEFEKVLQSGYIGDENDSDLNYGLLGLHTCGDLASTLLHLFCSLDRCRSIVSVSCCYMKLSTRELNNTKYPGYPLSKVVGKIPRNHMTYEARELACHAIEVYAERLRLGADNLKVHCYRAALEEIIVAKYPNLTHAGLRSVNNAHKMSFPKYAEEAISRLGVELPCEEYFSTKTQDNLSRWMEVVVFYSIRLMLAPVVETIILLDKLFFLYEQGTPGILAPVFDPKMSPRNYVIVAVKKKL